MSTEAVIAEELVALERAWDDDAGSRYRTSFLFPLKSIEEDLNQVVREFDDSLPPPPNK